MKNKTQLGDERVNPICKGATAKWLTWLALFMKEIFLVRSLSYEARRSMLFHHILLLLETKLIPSFSLLILAGSSCQSLSQMKFGDSQTKVFEMNASTICAPLEDLVVPLLSL